MKTLLVSLLFLGSSAMAATATYDLDQSHGQVGFDIEHLMISRVHGRFNKFSGTIKFDEVKREFQGADITIDAKSIDTNEPKRDGHLKSPDFLDVEKYPTITFKSDKTVNFSGKNAKVPGILTIHGISKPISLDMDMLGTATDPMGNFRISFQGRVNINRKDFGLKWNKNLDGGGVVVGDDVNISIEGEAVRQGGKK